VERQQITVVIAGVRRDLWLGCRSILANRNGNSS